MTNFSPSVVAREFDFSDYATLASTTILGVVGSCTKGPINSPTLIQNERELIDTFGYPKTTVEGTGYKTSNMILSCIQYLRQGNQLIVVRAGVSGSASASRVLNDSEIAPNPILNISAISPGSWASDVSVKTSAGTSGNNYYKLEILVGGVVRERYDNLTTLNSDPTNWASARINASSFLVRVAETGALNGLVPANIGPLALTGGTDPTIAESDYLFGLDQFADPELITINLLMTPGVANELSDTDHTVVNYALAMCESRGDTIYIADPLLNYADTAALKTSVNGLDSSYGCIYAPWLSVYDAYNKLTVWCPPSGFIAGQMAYNDRVAQAWFAPAGTNRGKIRSASGVKTVFRRSDLESLQAPREIVNPIRSMVGEGIVIWGQRTMQRKSSALDRINVRRMLNFAKSTVVSATRVLLFEQNDSKTWRRFSQLVTPIVQHIKDTQGLYDFRVICDATTNPPTVIDQNQMKGKILLKPTKTAEIITIDFNVLNTGASFNEFI